MAGCAHARFALGRPAVSEGDVTVRDFRFASGETLPSLRLHYRTLGTPGRPAVLVLHGTTGSGAQFLGDSFAGVLFGPGQLLDPAGTFIVLPDGIGHGGSSKPSDGLHGRFPHYAYADMVEAQRRVLDGLGGEYSAQPLQGLRAAMNVFFFMVSAPLIQQAQAPTRDEADKVYEEWMKKRLAGADANDVLYAFEASRDYDPSPALEKIEAALTAVNSADDQINPPELGILEREIKRVRRGKAIVLPIGPQTRGHGTHTNAAAWKDHLAELLERSAR